MHPDNLERGSLGLGMGWPFSIGVLTAFAAFLHLLLLRLDLETRRVQTQVPGAWAPDLGN